MPLLDELVDLLGRDKAADQAAEQAAERERKAEAAYAAGVMDLLVDRKDSMDDEDHLFATDLLYAEDLADRFVEQDTRELVERAAADRDWTYRHVVVDEAQELSEMDWRVLMRHCPARSFTVVGDLAQRRSVAGAGSNGTCPHPRHPTPRRPAPRPTAAGPDRTRRNRTRRNRDSHPGRAGGRLGPVEHRQDAPRQNYRR